MRKLIASIGVIFVILMSIAIVACGGDSEKSPTSPTPSPGEGITTASGLKYIEIESGTGLAPKKGDMVEVHYTGTLENGTKFDSSYDRVEPISFRLGVGQVIKGWDEGIGLMKVGGKGKLVVPPALGYGEQMVGNIPANSTLFFELELISVKPAEAPARVDAADYFVLPSGLKYSDVVEGSGLVAQAGQTVIGNYFLWLQDGSALGGTQDEGSPLMISLGKGTLRFGLDEGVVSMKEGGKRQLIVPPSLAFGESGYPPAVPPNATLILEMELLRVIPPAEPVPRTEVAEGDYASTPSGLKYFDIREGNGDSPQEEGQFVVVHYTGWLTDGTKFDSSVDGGEPLSFRYGVDPMIQGFVEGVSTMKVGGKRQLVIPPELGYGAQAAGSIPANSTLVFEVELLYVDQR